MSVEVLVQTLRYMARLMYNMMVAIFGYAPGTDFSIAAVLSNAFRDECVSNVGSSLLGVLLNTPEASRIVSALVVILAVVRVASYLINVLSPMFTLLERFTTAVGSVFGRSDTATGMGMGMGMGRGGYGRGYGAVAETGFFGAVSFQDAFARTAPLLAIAIALQVEGVRSVVGTILGFIVNVGVGTLLNVMIYFVSAIVTGHGTPLCQ